IRLADGGPSSYLGNRNSAAVTQENRTREFLRRGGRRNFFDVLEPIAEVGQRFQLFEGGPGDYVRIASMQDGVTSGLDLVLDATLDDGRTVLLVRQGETLKRLLCPSDGQLCEAR